SAYKIFETSHQILPFHNTNFTPYTLRRCLIERFREYTCNLGKDF
ncbi:LOW QUALITY PROTEIN: hypothetical protein EAWG_02530, partial [Escherichia coli TA008]